MDERPRDAEQSSMIHPIDADALSKLRTDSAFAKLVVLNVVGAAIVAIAAAAAAWLL